MELWKILLISIPACLIAVIITSGGCYVFWRKRRHAALHEYPLPEPAEVYQLQYPPFTVPAEPQQTPNLEQTPEYGAWPELPSRDLLDIFEH